MATQSLFSPGMGPMDFVAIDVETANPNLASVCQIGIVSFENGKVKESWQSLVNPEDYFDGINIAIHGIDEQVVRGAPTFEKIFEMIHNRIRGLVVASYTSFDRVAVAQGATKYGLSQFDCAWLDTARVVRRTWSDFSRRGYGLGKVAKKLGIEFAHHNAEEDARASGEILVRAIEETGIGVREWLDYVKMPIHQSQFMSSRSLPNGGAEGALNGEVVVFTGALAIPRREASRLAAEAGCQVGESVSHATTLLVVGDIDIRCLAGHEKSSKHRKAEELISKGQPIRIVMESDFRQLVGMPM